MKPHVVTQGETVASIASPLGADPDVVWEDAKNADLRAQRTDPAVLAEGDVLYVPDGDAPSHALNVGTTNSFTASGGTQTVRLVLAGSQGSQPIAGAAYVVKGLGGDDLPGSTGADGGLAVDVPIGVTSFELHLTDLDVAHQVLVGHLDPISTDSGVQQRLSNLGFVSPLAVLLAPLGVEVDTGMAVRLFQLANGLTPSGEADDSTIAAIQKAHGT